MAFGMNRVELIGRLGADVTVNHLTSGGRVANLSIATDESYIDRNGSGERVDKTEWHRVVTFQPGLIDMLERNAKKGRLVHAEGKLQTRRWSKPGEDGDRFSTEVLVVPGHRLQFLDKPNGANGNGARAAAQPVTEPANGGAMPAGGAPASTDEFDDSSDIPF
ncbi:MAG: single-stranded DNA-binding protein [Defluviicoccus sp.]|nr:single-stranded DNA-binding protein [Defluviicoccus sp.]MDE0277151.1 single-stranded DNA-binding protein [Defluviicoccus sp.]